MFSQPDFAEAAFAELARENPAFPLRDGQSTGRSPAERFLVSSGDGAPGLGRIRRRAQRRRLSNADLEDLDRLVASFEHVGPVGHPLRVIRRIVAAHHPPARQIKGAARDQCLTAHCQRHDASSHRLGKPLHLYRFRAASYIFRSVALNDQFPKMDARSNLKRRTQFG